MRARLHVLSEAPDEWEQSLVRWQKMNRPLLGEFDGDAVPDANEEYLIYQTLVGTWPIEPMRPTERDEYHDRILQYMEKALREAKIHTSWMNPSEPYETAVRAFITALFAPDRQRFADDLAAFVARIAAAGFVNSLAQLLLKMALPGMPDFYRGTELWDFNLVDPDNRRPVDYDLRRHRLKNLWAAADKDLPTFARELAGRWPDSDIKLWITSSGLQLRRDWSDVFAFGEYIPLTASGAAADHIIAFARRLETQTVICVVPRHFYRLHVERPRRENETGPPRADWADTQLVLPEDFPQEWASRLSGETYIASRNYNASAGNPFPMLSVAELFAVFPVALITARVT
jgi:(1->4)-alpha-D-glucan 1-alpha-D-glucosylmutase